MTEVKEVYGAVTHVQGTEAGAGEKVFRKLLKACINYEASDLHVKSDSHPRIRVRGELRTLNTDRVRPDVKGGQRGADQVGRFQESVNASTRPKMRAPVHNASRSQREHPCAIADPFVACAQHRRGARSAVHPGASGDRWAPDVDDGCAQLIISQASSK